MTIHNVNLNIHYTAPKQIWDSLNQLYTEMPYWSGYVNGTPTWYEVGEPEDGDMNLLFMSKGFNGQNC